MKQEQKPNEEEYFLHNAPQSYIIDCGFLVYWRIEMMEEPK